mgnify:CR=1 FL=1|jgi:hypothetical protein
MNMIDEQAAINANLLSPAGECLDEFSIENKFKFKDVRKNPHKVKKRRQIEEALDYHYSHHNDELADLGWH